jgi:RNA polymerase sigma factor (sigma-70 family)
MRTAPPGQSRPQVDVSERKEVALQHSISHTSVMSGSQPSSRGAEARPASGWFETTHWSMVLAAGSDEQSTEARAALEALCRTYWQPLVAYTQRQGYSAPDAQDLVQGFFGRILARRDLSAVRQERGRFRSYLLAALKNFIVNDWKRASAEKRGGGHVAVPLETPEGGVSGAPVDDLSPDVLFDRQWALALLDRVLEQLRSEHIADGREAHFACLRGFLVGDADPRPQSAIAAELGISEGAVKQAVFRLRQQYQKLLRNEVAHTVATSGDVDQELRHLIAALRR